MSIKHATTMSAPGPMKARTFMEHTHDSRYTTFGKLMLRERKWRFLALSNQIRAWMVCWFCASRLFSAACIGFSNPQIRKKTKASEAAARLPVIVLIFRRMLCSHSFRCTSLGCFAERHDGAPDDVAITQHLQMLVNVCKRDVHKRMFNLSRLSQCNNFAQIAVVAPERSLVGEFTSDKWEQRNVDFCRSCEISTSCAHTSNLGAFFHPCLGSSTSPRTHLTHSADVGSMTR